MSQAHVLFLLSWIGIAVLALMAGMVSVWSHTRRLRNTPVGVTASTPEEARAA